MSPRWWLLTRLLALQSVMDGRQQHGRSSRADQLEPLPPKLTRLKPPGSIALPSCPPGNAAPVVAPPAPSNQEDRPLPQYPHRRVGRSAIGCDLRISQVTIQG